MIAILSEIGLVLLDIAKIILMMMAVFSVLTVLWVAYAWLKFCRNEKPATHHRYKTTYNTWSNFFSWKKDENSFQSVSSKTVHHYYVKK